MLALEVSINGKVLYVAGFPEGRKQLSASIDVERFSSIEQARLVTQMPGTFDGGGADPLVWGEGHRVLAMGDEVTVKLVEVDDFTQPESMYAVSERRLAQPDRLWLLEASAHHPHKVLSCGFCHKTQHQVGCFIVCANRETMICDQCVSAAISLADGPDDSARSKLASRSDEIPCVLCDRQIQAGARFYEGAGATMCENCMKTARDIITRQDV